VSEARAADHAAPGPDATTSTGFSLAVEAATIPPFEVITSTGAAMPALRRPVSSRLR